MVATSVAAVLSTGENVVFATPVYDSPILTIYNPYELWKLNPSYIAAEYFYFIFAAATFYHAFTHRKAGNSLGLWLGCLFSGAIVELFTILSPQIGNFYHTQASVMVAGRTEPLYMLLGCYGGIQYLAVQLAFTTAPDVDQSLFRKLGLSLLSGLAGRYLWSLLDIIGAHMLWWVWHESDKLYEGKISGVPTASSFWILSETACIGLVYSCMRLRSALSISVTMAMMVPLLLNVPFMASVR
ncbi:hypothetical protein FOZ63_028304 [Perkinsus olseni]|uniref:DUF7802 domain-containing protein n=2 Tax=Perkinsus olseni TaxID=32597 RepID=A0A7J6SPQ1_PEROL|nr:hypothetical protein FOZ63_028304 [Perkinsus olseni]